MNRKILLCFFVLIIIPGFCTSAIGYSYQAEDTAMVKATVLGFDRDESNNALILLRIDGIVDYFHNQSAMYEPLEINQSVEFGFLWGHREVTPTNVSIEKGDRILAGIGYHYNFTSHNGHLYSYERICDEDEIKINGDCIPSECDYDKHLVNNRCEKLECKDHEGIVNHTCVALDCKSDEIAKEHECIKLECDYDEYAVNHSCVKLVCDDNEEIVNHTCSKLKCNILQKSVSNKCVLNWDIILGILLVLVIVLFFWYEDISRRFRKSKIYKNLSSNEFYISLFLVVFTMLVLLTPLFIRTVSSVPLLVGEEPCLHARIAQDLYDGKISLSLANYEIKPYHLLLASIGGGVYYASILVPPILGILSVVLLIQLFNMLKLNLLKKYVILTILVISPGFIYLFTFSTPHTLAVFLILAGLNLLIKNKRSLIFIGTLLFLLASLSSLFNWVLCFGIVLFLAVKKRRRKRLLVFLPMLLLLLIFPYHILNYIPRDTIYQFQQNILRDSITSFGALTGFSVFNLFLAFFGFVFTWKQKKKYALFYLLLIALVVFGLFLNKNYNMYWNFVVAYFSGLGFVYLLKTKWELKLVKELTILIIVCGLIFSTISYTKQLALMQPNKEVFDGLQWLRKEEQGLVLSHHSRGYWIEYISKKQAFVDGSYNLKTQELLNISDEIFYSRDLFYTNDTLSKHQITYIFIDKEMKQGLVWVKEEQGLLFLFRNNKTFKNLYHTPHAEIWRYIGR